MVLALAGARASKALALGGVGAWIWGKTGAWSGASAWAWASAWAGAGAWAGALVLALADVFWFTIVGPILGGAIGGYFTSIGIWAGAGVGLATVIQFWLIIGGLINATDVLEKSYRKNQIVLIFGIISILGLALGCCISWWLMSR